MVALGHEGYVAFQAKNNAYNADAVNYLKQSIQMAETGNPPATTKWTPFKDKTSALGWMYYDLGAILRSTDPASAIGYFYKASQLQSDFPKGFDLFWMAEAYNIDVEKAHQASLVFNNQPVSPESEAALAHWYQLMDRAIDFYARAVNAARAAGADAGNKEIGDEAMEQLTIYYKIRHPDATPAAIDAYVASVGNTPMPDPKSPLPALPAPTPATTGATTGTTPPMGTTTNGARPPLSAGTPTPGKGGATPPAKATPAKPASPRNNRRAH
jgi:hypothetical protein